MALVWSGEMHRVENEMFDGIKLEHASSMVHVPLMLTCRADRAVSMPGSSSVALRLVRHKGRSRE
jgi:hypothetical protein